MLDFADFNEEEQAAVDRIVKRAAVMTGRASIDLYMDISVVHAQTPLRLKEFADANDFNFAHDIGGIGQHLNRETGDLEDCFVPRFTA